MRRRRPRQRRRRTIRSPLTDIVVTAQKREQSLQKVPISINAFDSAALEALTAEDRSATSTPSRRG